MKLVYAGLNAERLMCVLRASASFLTFHISVSRISVILRLPNRTKTADSWTQIEYIALEHYEKAL